MADGYIVIYNPDKSYAGMCYEDYFQFMELSKHLGDTTGRIYAMRYEPDMWLCVVVLLGSLCGIGQEPLWLAPTLVVAAALYGAITVMRTEAVVRRFEKQCRKRTILRIPKFLYECVGAEADKLGITAWDEWPARRFALFDALLLEQSALLRELANDCGCTKGCKHTNRLPIDTRTAARDILCTKAILKLTEVAEAYRGALEANELRVEGLQGMIEQERGLQLPPAEDAGKEE